MNEQFSYVQKPWGGYQDLIRETSKVIKILDVNPNSSLSLQSHEKREEHWTVISGHGRAQIENDSIPIYRGSHVYISKGEKHRLINDSEGLLKVLELQLGDCSEEDITRYEDNYGRI